MYTVRNAPPDILLGLANAIPVPLIAKLAPVRIIASPVSQVTM